MKYKFNRRRAIECKINKRIKKNQYIKIGYVDSLDVKLIKKG